jgi:hypothetical protein
MRADVGYYFTGESEHTHLGEIEIDPPPGVAFEVGCTVRLNVGGRAKLGIVEVIQPAANGSAYLMVTLRLKKPALREESDEIARG